MFVPEDILDDIRESNDIVDVISEYVSLKKKGRNYFGLCPFHNEKTPSFSVQQDKQIYHCFGCGEGGNVFSFLMKYKNLGFVDAVAMLAERANIDIPDSRGEVSSEKISLKDKLYKINREAARFFYNNLQKSPQAIGYFKSRGISYDIIKRFGLGYSEDRWDALLKYLSSRGYSEELIEKAGLIVKRDKPGYYDRFRNRVMFPVIDTRGRVIGFGGRVTDDSKPKYLNSPETLVFNKGNNLYGLNIAAKHDADRKILIVEGYMDVIALHQYGIVNAVASLGTALTKEQAKLIKRYSDDVVICYDSDTAGQAATLRGLDVLGSAGCRTRILNIPTGKDPDEFIRAEGKEAFIESIENAIPLAEYKIKRKSEGFDISTTEGKIGFIKSSAQALIELNDPVMIDAYVVKLSGQTGISASALYDEVSHQRSAQGKERGSTGEGHISRESRYNNNIDGQKLYLEPAYVKAEKFILEILYKMKDYFEVIEKKLSCEDFNDETYKRVACIMYQDIKSVKQINPASIINSFENVDDMKKVAEIFSTEIAIDMDNIDIMVNDYINLINRSKLTSKRVNLISKIKECEEKGDVLKSAELLKQVVEIDRQLRMH